MVMIAFWCYLLLQVSIDITFVVELDKGGLALVLGGVDEYLHLHFIAPAGF